MFPRPLSLRRNKRRNLQAKGATKKQEKVTASYNKEKRKPIAAQRIAAIRYKKLEQQKTVKR